MKNLARFKIGDQGDYIEICDHNDFSTVMLTIKGTHPDDENVHIEVDICGSPEEFYIFLKSLEAEIDLCLKAGRQHFFIEKLADKLKSQSAAIEAALAKGENGKT